jgi:thymidylate synthase (FAD)
MEIKLLHNTPLDIANKAIGKCWDKETDKPEERMYRVGNKYKHSSTLEHIQYTFDIDGISRACLQELARHRHASMSVKSTRYTLKELKDSSNYKDFLVQTGNDMIDRRNFTFLSSVRSMLNEGLSNDIVKYMLPEAYKTSLVWTINMRSLQNFLYLRTSKAALWEIRDLANNIYDKLPEDHKFMLKDSLNG